jgi:probable HAF family extracellular repeat protein
MTDLGNLGGQITNVTPSSINNKGQIVGVVSGYEGPIYGFIYTGGVMTDLNTLIDPASGWTVIRANGINNSGQIIAIGENSLARQHALLLTLHPILKNMHISGGRAQFMLSGTTGATYRVDYTLSLPATNWLTLTNVPLSSSPTQLVDPSSASVGQRYYRAVQE